MNESPTSLPNRTLELLSVAIADFLQDPESETQFSGLDWMIRVTAAKWGSYSMTRRGEGAKTPMPTHAGNGDLRSWGLWLSGFGPKRILFDKWPWDCDRLKNTYLGSYHHKH